MLDFWRVLKGSELPARCLRLKEEGGFGSKKRAWLPAEMKEKGL